MTLQTQFNNFDRQNPQLWDLFVKYSLLAQAAGNHRLSAQLIIERIRWEYAVTLGRKITIGNNHTAYYARKFHAAYPEYDGLFNTCKLRSVRTFA